jgi:protein arginine N-methyltransferase 5
LLFYQHSFTTYNIAFSQIEWIDADSAIESVRRSSDIALIREAEWACHLGLTAIIIKCPLHLRVANLAKSINHILAVSQYLKIQIRLPLVFPIHSTLHHSGCVSEDNIRCHTVETNDHTSWQIWDQIRFMTNHNPRLGIALELSYDLPESIEMISQWSSEPITCIIIPISIFIKNKAGYPVLSKLYQEILITFLQKCKPSVLFSGKPRDHNTYHTYYQYIRYIYTKYYESLSSQERSFLSYNDTLQAPLQPLMDNLESQTYEVFENDIIKYHLYQQAIETALIDLCGKKEHNCYVQSYDTEGDNNDFGSDPLEHKRKRQYQWDGMTDLSIKNETVNHNRVVILVVGAGRGPLVHAAIEASHKLQQNFQLKIYAIEKNPNAVITLRNRKLTEHWENVDIYSCDIREWTPIEQADILVSELLGSWGDNELSPECIDYAERCLKRDGGISIPCQYNSYIAPLSSNKLFMCARDIGLMDPSQHNAGRFNRLGLDTPYVVKLSHCHEITCAKKLFSFYHPRKTIPDDYSNHSVDNTRYGIYVYKVTQPFIPK